MIQVPNSDPKVVSFVQKGEDKNAALIASQQIARLSREEVIAQGEVENANFRLAKATETLSQAQADYFTEVEKGRISDSLKWAYNNALAGFREADKSAQVAGENLELAKSALAGALQISKAGGSQQGHAFRGNQYTHGVYGESHGMIKEGRADYVKPQRMASLAGRFSSEGKRFGQGHPAQVAHEAVSSHLKGMAWGNEYPSAYAWSKLRKLTEAAGKAAEEADSVKKRKFSSEKRETLADKGKALPDGSFPIESKGDLKNAISAYGRASNKPAAKKHIIAQAEKLGASEMLPEDWSDSSDNVKKWLVAKAAVMVLCPNCMSGDDSGCETCGGMNDGMMPASVMSGMNDYDGDDDEMDDSSEFAKAFSTDDLLTPDYLKVIKGGPGSGARPGHEFYGNQHTGKLHTYTRGERKGTKEGWKSRIKRYKQTAESLKAQAEEHMAQGIAHAIAGRKREAVASHREAAKKLMQAQGAHKGIEMIHRERADAGHPDASHTVANEHKAHAKGLREQSARLTEEADRIERSMGEAS